MKQNWDSIPMLLKFFHSWLEEIFLSTNLSPATMTFHSTDSILITDTGFILSCFQVTPHSSLPFHLPTWQTSCSLEENKMLHSLSPAHCSQQSTAVLFLQCTTQAGPLSPCKKSKKTPPSLWKDAISQLLYTADGATVQILATSPYSAAFF